MSQVNMLTYQIALIPENAGKIDAINRILLGEGYATSPVAEANAKTKAADKPAKTQTKVEPQEPELNDTEASMDDLKAAAKVAKKDHGEDFVKAMMEQLGIKPLASLGRCMSKIPVEQYDEIIALWQAGPQESADDDLGDDDGLGEETPTPEAVKLALKAMSQGGDREGAKELMAANGAKKLSDVDNCTPSQLKAMFAKLV